MKNMVRVNLFAFMLVLVGFAIYKPIDLYVNYSHITKGAVQVITSLEMKPWAQVK